MIKPPKLVPGATIAVVAPAGPIAPSQLTPGISALRSLGYTVILGEHIYKANNYLAGEDEERLYDLNWAIRDSNIQAIFCARGGYGSMRLLSSIDYKAFSGSPKIFVGFSDITALLHAIYYNCSVVSFHGPMVKNFRGPDDGNLKRLLEILTGGPRWEMDLEGARVLRPGAAEGVILGGNLSILASLSATAYLPDLKGAILFIEDTAEPPYRIDRMLLSLKFRGCLDNVRAIVAGEFYSCGNPADIDNVLLELTKDLDVPIVSGAPFGHGRKNFTFPIGVSAELDAEKLIVRGDCPVR